MGSLFYNGWKDWMGTKEEPSDPVEETMTSNFTEVMMNTGIFTNYNAEFLARSNQTNGKLWKNTTGSL